jgi:hypothetical protein
VEALLTAQKVWQDRHREAENDEESFEEMPRDDEGSVESEENVQRHQKRCRNDNLNNQVSILLIYLSKSPSKCSLSLDSK